MSKLKIGGKVRIIKKSFTSLFEVGDVVYVRGYANTSTCPYYLSRDMNKSTNYFAPFREKYVPITDTIRGGKLI